MTLLGDIALPRDYHKQPQASINNPQLQHPAPHIQIAECLVLQSLLQHMQADASGPLLRGDVAVLQLMLNRRRGENVSQTKFLHLQAAVSHLEDIVRNWGDGLQLGVLQRKALAGASDWPLLGACGLCSIKNMHCQNWLTDMHTAYAATWLWEQSNIGTSSVELGTTKLIRRAAKLLLTALELGLVLELVVRLHAAQELLLAARGVHVLNAHMDALRDDPAVYLRSKRQRFDGKSRAFCCTTPHSSS
jgi:hypothetical protein